MLLDSGGETTEIRQVGMMLVHSDQNIGYSLASQRLKLAISNEHFPNVYNVETVKHSKVSNFINLQPSLGANISGIARMFFLKVSVDIRFYLSPPRQGRERGWTNDR